MNLSEIIKKFRNDNKMSMEELANRCNLSKGYISMLENQFKPTNTNKNITPSIQAIRKLSIGMKMDFEYLLSSIENVSLKDDIDSKYDDKRNDIAKNSSLDNLIFDNAQQAFEFILSQPSVSAYGGYDLDRMSDEEIIAFAEDIQTMMRIIATKYSK